MLFQSIFLYQYFTIKNRAGSSFEDLFQKIQIRSQYQQKIFETFSQIELKIVLIKHFFSFQIHQLFSVLRELKNIKSDENQQNWLKYYIFNKFLHFKLPTKKIILLPQKLNYKIFKNHQQNQSCENYYFYSILRCQVVLNDQNTLKLCELMRHIRNKLQIQYFRKIYNFFKMNPNKSIYNDGEQWNFNEFQMEQNINQNDVHLNTLLDFSKNVQGNQNLSNPTSTNILSQPVLKSQEHSSKQEVNSSKRSIFHNFQKHLVITLRKAIKIKKGGKKLDFSNIAEKIWEIFLQKSTIYTKNILHILFGVVDYEGSELNNVYDQQIIQKFGYSQIFTTYSEEKILQAQAYLRQEVIKQLRQTNLDTLLQKRRIANIKQFKEYVNQFIEELQQGPMRKRLPKTKKQTMKLNQASLLQ